MPTSHVSAGLVFLTVEAFAPPLLFPLLPSSPTGLGAQQVLFLLGGAGRHGSRRPRCCGLPVLSGLCLKVGSARDGVRREPGFLSPHHTQSCKLVLFLQASGGLHRPPATGALPQLRSSRLLFTPSPKRGKGPLRSKQEPVLSPHHPSPRPSPTCMHTSPNPEAGHPHAPSLRRQKGGQTHAPCWCQQLQVASAQVFPMVHKLCPHPKVVSVDYFPHLPKEVV